ncbi:pyridoxamine 5'-phosphate oxidase [Nocardia tenerifensis]|uniref:Pyridoxamine 5'-phosphate oxidase n=1 Tax=Nocardia tenerifensis TaxID=228006 RepID=A0A318K8R5_9NOCA|nr:pyridoxamine 5'-phosphate oxidase family protein [Nocardia tenerifensis]PXX70698.1 pyridoxamine 5'-phosphate oxidase [Nocardia tenerifensis]
MALTLKERQEFLAQPHVAALSVAGGAGRGPLSVPIWYQYEPGGEPWILTGAESRKMRSIKESGRFTLMVQRTEPTTRYVSVEGAVSKIAPITDEAHVELVRRYLSGDAVDKYLKQAAGFGEQLAVYLRPEHWLSADLGSV